MGTSAYIMSILVVPTDDAEWLGLTAEEVAHLRSEPCRLPTLKEVVSAIDSLGIDAHHPHEISGHEGSYSVRNLATEHAIAAALRLAPKTGPLIVVRDSEGIPVVVCADDDEAERIAWFEARSDLADQEARQWVHIAPLSSYQWGWRSEGGRELVTDLAWLETLGEELPVSDYHRNVAPHPDQIAGMLDIAGEWNDTQTIWTADAQHRGLGYLEVRLDAEKEPLSLRCRAPKKNEAVALAADLMRTLGPMVIGRWCGPSVLIVEATALEKVTPLLGQDDARIQGAIARLESSGLAMATDIEGCSEAEIGELETALGIDLPTTYREFLLQAGRRAGTFMRGSDLGFDLLLDLNRWAREFAKEEGLELQDSAFAFIGHQGYQFLFFVTGTGGDPAVYRCLEGEGIVPVRPSFSAWLLGAIDDESESMTG